VQFGRIKQIINTHNSRRVIQRSVWPCCV